MSYILINGDDTHYNVSITPFTTQNGYDAIRFKGDEIPETDAGFKLYSDTDSLLADYSDYKYIYRPNEYSVEQDEIKPPVGSNQPLPSYNPLEGVYSRLSQLSSQVNEITPYTESKTAYIDDEYVIFDIAKDGNVSVFMVDGDGQTVPFTYEIVNGQIRVSFEKRESLATVTISIQ